MTDLTFIEDGIPSIIKKTNLINFAKRAKTAEVIREIQQYQNVPYALQPVQELQDYILRNMQSAGDVHEMYERSLQVEPREREDEKIARYFRSQPVSKTITDISPDYYQNLASCDQKPGPYAPPCLTTYLSLLTPLITTLCVSKPFKLRDMKVRREIEVEES